MKITSVKFKNYHCFKDDWAGFEGFRPVNVIIGRNNTGKSRLIDLVAALCDKNISDLKWDLEIRGAFEKDALKRSFGEGTSGGELGGDFWREHGRHFVGVDATAVFCRGKEPEVELHGAAEIGIGLPKHVNERVLTARRALLGEVAKNTRLPLHGKKLLRLAAERNILPEKASNELTLGPDGHGATNIIRRYLNSSRTSLPREVIDIELLAALNEVFGTDGHFLEIETRQHDEPEEADQSSDHWEIYLAEKSKGLIALSRSGSGLKTVLLVLLNLLVVPAFQNRVGKIKEYVFALEELETHLHPALLRRLFAYIERYIVKHNSTVFITTHSSVALDVYGVSPNAQIIHVKNDGISARTTTVAEHFDRHGVIAELGAKPSDLLQANGVIWVEGPSDRIYLNRWIELVSGEKWKEGRDYICAFYGGALLANDQFTAPEDADPRLSNLLRLNANVVLVCDSDRTAISGDGSELKARVLRVQHEMGKVPSGYLWITETKEIENYLPAAALHTIFGDKTLEAPKARQRFFPTETRTDSYVEQRLNRKGIDKVDLAIRATHEMVLDDLKQRFDWELAMQAIVAKISEWNK